MAYRFFKGNRLSAFCLRCPFDTHAVCMSLADNQSLEKDEACAMYAIQNQETGLLLHHYPDLDLEQSPGRHGWGEIDSTTGMRGQPVLFDLYSAAQEWMASHEKFCRDATAVEFKPRGRGRPRSGQAATAAERKRRQRQRLEDKIFTEVAPGDLSTTDLIEGIAVATRAGKPELVNRLAAELERRASERRSSSRNCREN